MFPAAILQAPFFNEEADDAVNMGSFGAVVAHELTHGFDDSGSQYDAKGNLHDWWTAVDKAEFSKRVETQVAQASEYVVHGKNLNGSLCAGENLADLGGLRLSYRALAAAGDPAKSALIDGYTQQQRFFFGWAQLWREVNTKENQLRLLTLDPHGPNSFRINGPLMNVPEFYDAFGVKEGDAMFLAVEKRVDIW